ERPDDFDPLGYVARSLAMMPSTWLIEIVLDAPLEELQQQLPQTLATLELIEEGVLLRCWAGSLEWFALILLGLNYPMKIRQPAELSDVLRDLAKRSHAIADSSENTVEASRRIEAH
ncbi:MAG TPA: WYL domain-containing protein, partial [Ktedonobacteraceae bacterium]|nr:WYL domain-containing protein [Ktedonobacteraceae bacterium]